MLPSSIYQNAMGVISNKGDGNHRKRFRKKYNSYSELSMLSSEAIYRETANAIPSQA